MKRKKPPDGQRPPPEAAAFHRLEHLIAAGRRLSGLSSHASGELDALRLWQRECATTIGQLAGGSKAHWLARAFSDAFLVPQAESASATLIVKRILAVLDRARSSLASSEYSRGAGPSGPPDEAEAPADKGLAPRLFEFIQDPGLRDTLKHAYVDAQAALARAEFALALITFSSILEAIVTDALDRHGAERLAACDPPSGPIASWSFADRLLLAERARLISAASARLPVTAREYRALIDERGEVKAESSVTERDARRTGQVLHVILRDRSPGR